MVDKNTPLADLKRVIRKDHTLDVDIELKNRIVSNDSPSVNYFLGDFSSDIVDYISSHIIFRNSLTEYFQFFSEPLDSENIPSWHKLSLYKGDSNCTLHTYSSTLSCRYFCGLAKKERKRRNMNEELIDYVDYEALLKCDQPESSEDDIRLIRVKKAYQKLNDKDQHALRLLVIEKKRALEVFDELSPYITPRTSNGLSSDEIKKSWDNKRKQDAISLMKGRAVSHLIEMYHKIK